jgi:hypothetical protein
VRWEKEMEQEKTERRKYDHEKLRSWAAEFSHTPLPLHLNVSQVDAVINQCLPSFGSSEYAHIPKSAIKLFEKRPNVDEWGRSVTKDGDIVNVKLDEVENEMRDIIFGTGMFREPFPGTAYQFADPAPSQNFRGTIRHWPGAVAWLCLRLCGLRGRAQPRWLTRLFFKGLLYQIYGPCIFFACYVKLFFMPIAYTDVQIRKLRRTATLYKGSTSSRRWLWILGSPIVSF